MRQLCPGISSSLLQDLVERCGEVIATLEAVSNETASVAAAAAQSLREVRSELERALAIGVLFVNPILLSERARGFVAYGLTLQREGASREGLLVLSIAIALIGLIPPLAIPASIASITWAIAERCNEQEVLGKQAAKRLTASSETDPSTSGSDPPD
jgi:hypothetical protein